MSCLRFIATNVQGFPTEILCFLNEHIATESGALGRGGEERGTNRSAISKCCCKTGMILTIRHKSLADESMVNEKVHSKGRLGLFSFKVRVLISYLWGSGVIKPGVYSHPLSLIMNSVANCAVNRQVCNRNGFCFSNCLTHNESSVGPCHRMTNRGEMCINYVSGKGR